MTRLSFPRLFATCLVAAAGMTACGGGNEVEKPASFELLPTDLVGAPCARCRAGHLVGVAADGAPLADAEVLVTDARGRTARARTAADGRYEVATAGLTGAMLVQVTGSSSGEPVVLHAPAVEIDVGNRAVNVTPLTELVSAYLLGGTPHELLQDGRADFMRIQSAALRSSVDRVMNLVRPVAALAGADALDLRTGDFGAGLDALNTLLTLERRPAGYALRAAASAQPPVLVDPVASSTDAVLAPLAAQEQAAARAALAALPEIERQLGQFAAQFAGGLPAAEALAPWFEAGFFHTGLDAAAFATQVLLRRDAEELGGFSLQGARIGALRLLQVASAQRLLVRFEVQPRAPWPAYAETLWLHQVGGRWLWQGDGQAGAVRVRPVAVLGARPADAAALLALPGMRCGPVADTTEPQCRIEGGQGGVPAGGLLYFGSPDDAQFGLFAAYHADAAGWPERLAAARLHSRALGTPSARVSRHLALEVDARRLDPRTRRVRVSGPGLPAEGLELAAGEGARRFDFLPLAGRPEDDAHLVPLGRCPALSGAALDACRDAWNQLRAGAAYDFAFLDPDGAPLQTLTARLGSTPLPESALAAQPDAWFARFDLAGTPAQQLHYARVADAALQGGRLRSAWAWRPAGSPGLRLLGGEGEVLIAEPSSGQTELRRFRRPPPGLLGADGAAVWAQDVAMPPGWLPVWMAARLVARDALGNHFIHYIAPNNPL